MTRSLGVAALCLSLGCNATETGNPAVPTQLGLTGHSRDPEAVAISPNDGDIVIEEAWVVLGDVRFVPFETCDDAEDGRVDITGPVVAQIVGDGPAIVEFDVPAGDYCRVRVPLDRLEDTLPDGSPPELAARSLLVRGQRSDGTPIEIRSSAESEADLRSDGAPFAISGAMAALVLVFDLAAWFDELELDSAELTDGRILVDEGINEELADRFDDNVERSLRLHRDDDEDGELDDEDERVAGSEEP